MTQAINLPDQRFKLPHTLWIEDQFHHFVSGQQWTAVLDAGVTATITEDGLVLTNGGVLNDFGYVKMTVAKFKAVAQRTLEFFARIKITEANVDDASIMLGFHQDVVAGSLADGSGAIAANTGGAFLHKIAGTNRWRAVSGNDNSGEIVQTETDVPTATASWVTVKIQVTCRGEAAEISYWIDPNGGQAPIQSRQYGVVPMVPPIKHSLALANLAAWKPSFGVKSSSANGDALAIGYVFASQSR